MEPSLHYTALLSAKPTEKRWEQKIILHGLTRWFSEQRCLPPRLTLEFVLQDAHGRKDGLPCVVL